MSLGRHGQFAGLSEQLNDSKETQYDSSIRLLAFQIGMDFLPNARSADTIGTPVAGRCRRDDNIQ
jgi:hypothetical protein